MEVVAESLNQPTTTMDTEEITPLVTVEIPTLDMEVIVKIKVTAAMVVTMDHHWLNAIIPFWLKQEIMATLDMGVTGDILDMEVIIATLSTIVTQMETAATMDTEVIVATLEAMITQETEMTATLDTEVIIATL